VNASEDAPTIAAISTPPGPGGIGIIRLSGTQSLPILQRLFRPHLPKDVPKAGLFFENRRMYTGWIIDLNTGSPIDEVLTVHMHAPHTYTAEDVVEIQCHGSYLVLQEILEQVFLAGARPAAPGEFTKRAFLNGRIDLTRAEAVIEIIEARTRVGLNLATAQLQGRLYQQVMAIREALIAILAVLEVAIDFPEEEMEIIDPAALQEQLFEKVQQPLTELIAAADQGKIFRDGISAVILGRPNVGKSSLLNCLLKEERALVTPVPGTTRDTIEEFINIKGMPIRIIDTAGIRDTEELVEGMGIERARAKLATAELILLMFDASSALTAEDRRLFASIKNHNANSRLVVVLNKTDLPLADDFAEDLETDADVPRVSISAKTMAGLDQLTETIFTMMTGGSGDWDPGTTAIPNLRHKDAMHKALTACSRIAAGLQQNLPPDLIAIELQAVLDHLGDIVGETTSEDVLDMIFERFCIGK
jgi:tRNA modification GTPase